MSEYRAKQQHQDYDDVVSTFVDAARGNPALIQQLNAHPDPAQFAYETGRTYAEAEKYGSISEMEKSIEERVRAEYEKKLADAQRAAAAKGPRSLAGARGSSAPAETAEDDDSVYALLG